LSLVSEGKPLPAIAEITELVSLSDNSPRTFKLAPFGLAAKNNNAPGEEYKIDPQLIKKAEDLLGKASLDNTDLTITSLNFIDEQQQQQQQQQQNGRKLQECFKRMQSPKEEQKVQSWNCEKITHSDVYVDRFRCIYCNHHFLSIYSTRRTPSERIWTPALPRPSTTTSKWWRAPAALI